MRLENLNLMDDLDLGPVIPYLSTHVISNYENPIRQHMNHRGSKLPDKFYELLQNQIMVKVTNHPLEAKADELLTRLEETPPDSGEFESSISYR